MEVLIKEKLMLSKEVYRDVKNQSERELKYSTCFIENWYKGRQLTSSEILFILDSERISIADYLHPHVSSQVIESALNSFEKNIKQRVLD